MHLAIIPARGGSKRIPHKNMAPFAGRPLMTYAISTADRSGLFDEIHVSTDDVRIAEIAAAEGFAPRFMRPDRLSDDQTGLLEVLRWVVETYGDHGMEVDTVTLIYATAPFLRPADLIGGMGLYRDHDGEAPVLSVAEYPAPAQWASVIGDDGRLRFLDFEATQTRSQDLPKTFFDAAAFNIYARTHLMDLAAVKLSYLPYELPKARVTDIDTPDDLAMAEALFRALAHE